MALTVRYVVGGEGGGVKSFGLEFIGSQKPSHRH